MEEKILYKTKTHPKVLVKAIVIQIVLLALHILIIKFWPTFSIEILDKWGQLTIHALIICLEIYYVIVPVLQWYNNIFTVTNYRVINEWGILNKKSKEIDLKNIVSATTDRDILDRIFGCGTLIFYGAASSDWDRSRGRRRKDETNESNTGIKFYDVPKVKYVENAINKLRRKI